LAIDALTLANVHAYYGDSHVLHDISLSVESGKLLALLGRNGAGKTTCISSIIGFLRPPEGEIRLFGKRISGLSPEAISQLGVGLVPQGRRVFPSLSVNENLTVSRQRERTSAQPYNLGRIYEMFPALAGRRNQLAGTLSGGEQQMLAFGRALMGNPRLLLLDEPSEGLAPLIVAEISKNIARLKQEGLTIVLVEQNSALVFELADEVAILNTGRCSFSGPVEKIRDDEQLIAQNLGVFHASHSSV